MREKRYFSDPVSGRKVLDNYLIEQIMPAPDWRVRVCNFENGKSFVSEVPVIGWATISRSGSDDNTFMTRYTTLLCAHMTDNLPFGRTVEELREHGETGVRTIPPSGDCGDEDLIEDTREELEGLLRLSLEDEEWARELYGFIIRDSGGGGAPSFSSWRKRYAERLRKKLGITDIPAVA